MCAPVRDNRCILICYFYMKGGSKKFFINVFVILFYGFHFLGVKIDNVIIPPAPPEAKWRRYVGVR